MSSIALGQLIQAVRSRADMIDSGFVDDATEVVPWINEAGAELHDLVVSRFEDDFTLTSDSITVSSGNTIELVDACPNSAPFYKLRGLDRLESGSSDWRSIKMFDFNIRNRRTSGSSWYRANAIRYRLIGSAIHLTPDDSCTGTYRLWYVPGYVDLYNEDDELSYPQNWHEFVIATAAAKCLAKEESDVSVQLTAKAELKARIMAMAPNRDAGARMRIEDVRSRAYGGGFDDDDEAY